MILLTTWWSILPGPVSWLGCASDDAGPVEPDPTGDTGPTVQPPLGDDEGSLVVASWLPGSAELNPRTQTMGMFAESREGVINLAQCVASFEAFCAPSLPAKPGDSVVVTPKDPLLTEQLDTVHVGEEIRLGPWAAPYDVDDNGNGFYYWTEPGASLPTEPVALQLGGDWGEYAGGDIPVPTPIEVTSPDPSGTFVHYQSTPLDLRWTPGGEGQIWLVVTTAREDRLFLLDDDGQESIDLTPLSLPDGSAIDLILGRWTVTEIDHQGNDLNVQIQSNQRLGGTWREATPRVELTELYDECAAAEAAPGVAPGSYTGDLASATRDLDPGTGGCTGFQARGPDALVPIDLLPDDLLTVDYRLLADDASLYLVTDCADAGTCLVGSDRGKNGAAEQIVYLNATGVPQRVFVVLDAFNGVSDPFELDIAVETLGGDVLVPTCIEAMDQGPIGSGTYRGSLALHADLLDPDCAAPAGGGEGMLQLYLEPGGTVRATARTAGADPKMYLLYHCAIEESCFYADGNQSGDSEDLVYTNTTGVAEFFYLVVDSDTNLGDYELDLTVQ